MDNIAQRLKAYIEAHPFDPGDSDYETVLNQLYQVYQESHESDPPDIRDGFRELDDLLRHLPLEDNNTVFNLCCSLLNMSPRLYTPGRARCTPSSPETEQRRRRGCTLTLPDLHGIIDVSKCWEE